jgi:hypothetical protein
VTRWTKQHQIADVVYVYWSSLGTSARTVWHEGDDMRHFGKNTFSQRHVMFEQISVAPVEFAMTAGANEEE